MIYGMYLSNISFLTASILLSLSHSYLLSEIEQPLCISVLHTHMFIWDTFLSNFECGIFKTMIVCTSH